MEFRDVRRLADAGQARSHQLNEIDTVRSHVSGDEDVEIRVLDEVTELVFLVSGVDRDRNGPEEGNAEKKLDVFDLVRHEQSNVIPGPDPERTE